MLRASILLIGAHETWICLCIYIYRSELYSRYCVIFPWTCSKAVDMNYLRHIFWGKCYYSCDILRRKVELVLFINVVFNIIFTYVFVFLKQLLFHPCFEFTSMSTLGLVILSDLIPWFRFTLRQLQECNSNMTRKRPSCNICFSWHVHFSISIWDTGVWTTVTFVLAFFCFVHVVFQFLW